MLRWNPSVNPCRRSVFRWRVAASFRERRQSGWEHGGEQESGRDYLRFRGVPVEGREPGGEQHLRLRVPRNEGRVQDEGRYRVPVLPVGSPDPHVDLRWVKKIEQPSPVVARSNPWNIFIGLDSTPSDWKRASCFDSNYVSLRIRGKGNEIFLS